VAQTSLVTKMLQRPELGALIGALVIFFLFWSVDTTGNFAAVGGTAGWTDIAAPIGIIAVFVALLMIGGEFDLSTGVMVGTSGLLAGILTTEYNLNVWVAILIVFAFAATVGFINGVIVVRTGLPSFIVTLATFFVLRGANLAVTKELTGTVRVANVEDSAGFEGAFNIFASRLEVGTSNFQFLSCGGLSPRSSRPGCSPVPSLVTGFLPPVATRLLPVTRASRSTGPRSPCS